MLNEVLFSSKSEEWETPLDLFSVLDGEYHFTLDPCATEKNAKCKKFFTKQTDGLLQNWQGNSVFCNPPYGRKIVDWVKKCYEEGQKTNTTVVLLIPSKTDTAYFHDYIWEKAEIHFLRGRLRFCNSKNAAPFPSLIAVFGTKAKINHK